MPEIDVKKINFQYLSQLLDFKREEHFIKEFIRYLSSSEQNANLILSEVSSKGSLLHIAIRNQLHRAVEVLVQHGADVNGGTKTKQSAALLACEVGDDLILEFLLINSNLQLEVNHKALPLLSVVVRLLKKEGMAGYGHQKCFDLLIEDPRISVNGLDEFGNTALHYAVLQRNERIIHQLMNRGAFIATDNNRGESPLVHFDYDLLSRYMDKCLEVEKDSTTTTAVGSLSDGDGGIKFNYRAFLPPEGEKGNELTAINRMAENKDLRDLVAHPLIAVFISVKWNFFSLFFNLNLISYSLFCITLLMYSSLCYIYDDQYSYSLALWLSVFITFSYVCLITCMNILLVPQHSIRLLRCYVELILIGLAFVILFVQQQTICTRRIVTGSTVITAGLELLLLIHTIQSQFMISTLSHVKSFLITLIHSFAVYCILIIVFSLSFWTNQMHGGDSITMRNETAQPPVMTISHLSPIAGIVKNAVHIMGEFDASKVDLYASAISYFIIFLFLVFLVIIIFNVFNKFMFSSESFGDVTSNLVAKAWHLHKTEELLGRFRCSRYNLKAPCLPWTLSMPYFLMAKMVRLFSEDAQPLLIVYPLASPTEYLVVIPGRQTAKRGQVGHDGEIGAGAEPPHHLHKRVQLDRVAFQEARLTIEHRGKERAEEQAQEEQLEILKRLEYKINVLVGNGVGEKKQKRTTGEEEDKKQDEGDAQERSQPVDENKLMEN